MPIARPIRLADAVDALAGMPDAELLAGGTDLMVEVNLADHRPAGIVALRRVEELHGITVTDDVVDIGAGVTYRQIEEELADLAPALAMAARTVGSPQIRNVATIGGNIGTASPAGDTLPWLLACDAEVELTGPAGTRTLPLDQLLISPKQTALSDGEVIGRIRVARLFGPQHFAKVGPRNAMAIAVASVAVVLDSDARRVRVGLGAVGPTPLRPHDAEAAVSAAIDWDTLTCDTEAVEAFGRQCADAAAPIDDHRNTAAYRRHAIGVLAARSLRWCLSA